MNNFQRTTMNDVETELRIQKMLTQELVKLPEGRIKTSREGKSYYTGKKGQYKSAAKDIEFITQLRRRRLIEEKLRRIEKNLHWQEKTLIHYKPYDDDSVMRDLPKAYQEMETEQRESIQRIPLENLTDYHAEELVHRTASGELRRSKSEVIISMLLDAYGVNYTYEERLYWPFGMSWEAEQFKAAVGLRDSVLPDFTIILPDGERMYWEHLGLLNKPEYAEDWMRKMLFYHWLGIDHGRNMIVTADDCKGHIDQLVISEIIQTQILKK